MRRISALWAKHIDDAEKKKAFHNSVLASKDTLDRLVELIDEMIEDVETKQENFDTPSWAYQQASLIGEKRTLRKIKRLITFN